MRFMIVEHQFWGMSGQCSRTRPDASADTLGADFEGSAWRCSNTFLRETEKVFFFIFHAKERRPMN